MSEMNRPARLVLIRHGTSDRNEAKKGSIFFPSEGHRDLVRGIADHKNPLSKLGILEAYRTGCELRKLFGIPDYLYHSGYARTQQTAEEIVKAYKLHNEDASIRIRMNSFIRERDTGYAYDMTTKEAEEAFPWLKEHWTTAGGFFARPPGGESLADVANRVYTFLNMLFRDRAGQTVFVVTHGGTLRSFRFLLERWDYDRALTWPEGESPKNCGVTDYAYNPDTKRLELQTYNCVF